MEKTSGGWHRPLRKVEGGSRGPFLVVTELGLTEVKALYVQHVCDPQQRSDFAEKQRLAALIPMPRAEGLAYADNEHIELNRQLNEEYEIREKWLKTPEGWRQSHLEAQGVGPRGKLALEQSCLVCGALVGEPCQSTAKEKDWRVPEGQPPYTSRVHNQRRPKLNIWPTQREETSDGDS